MIRFIAYSDYLCPWCWNASRRLWRLADEYEGRIELEWRSYLLRPIPSRGRDRERFRAYTESWLRPAAEEDAGPFRVWATDASPPSHSVPPHAAAKAAARVSDAAFRAMHERLMIAYFADNRDISDHAELRAIWEELELPAAGFDAVTSKQLEPEIHREFEEARELGATGVPGVRRADNEIIIVGAQPEAVYRRWIEKSFADGIET
jgi:predicted DsbA family dithiol-disulfide isomerase